jgi:hypothetical protein
MNKIAMLNDKLRKEGVGHGMLVVTSGVAEASNGSAIVRAVREFDDFCAENDPYKEHNFGKVTISGENYFWKIDYYDSPKCTWGAEDPADESTFRVLTIMRADEY